MYNGLLVTNLSDHRFNSTFNINLQEDSQLTDSRPGTSSGISHVDPLSLDLEDLYVKYKVSILFLIC